MSKQHRFNRLEESVARRSGRAQILLSIALLVLSALPAAAHSDESDAVTVDGVSFDGWSELVGSDFFKVSGLRCATPSRAVREGLYGAFGNDPSDCSASSTNPTPGYDPNQLYEIPVVVHIIMDSACSQGAISDALVDSQIEILNEDLLALAGTNGGNGTDAQIRFVLASQDPNGAPTGGITRSCNTTWFNDSGSYWNTLAWDPHRYLNIYTNQASGALGYVPFLPADGGGSQVGTAADRVVILWSSFGRNGPIGPPYDQGRTSTHEVGHYLGLEHTFNSPGSCGSASPPGCYSDGDLICDTNVERDPGSSPCHVGASSSCGSVDPTDNYMDYSDDLCMERFTLEQIRRVRCTMEHYRPDVFRVVGGGNTPPNVNITAPSNGASFPEGTSISFAGSANDAEDGDLTASLAWTSSLDGAIGTGGAFSATLSVGTHTITASVTDSGGLTGSALISVMVTPTGNAPPAVNITTPPDGASFPEGTSIAFAGSATDAEDGDLTANLAWSSSRDGAIGTGGSFSATLSVGTHTVTASVTDSGGATGSASISVTVNVSCAGGGGLVEDFESGAGSWSSGGLWHLVTSSGCASPGHSSPVRAMYYGQDASCDYDTGNTTAGNLVSPEIAGITAASTLTFDYFREVEFETSDAYDRTLVSVRQVGGSWTTVWSKDSRDTSENTWTSSDPISLAAWAGQTIEVRFRFDSVDEISNDFTGWMIDDVVVTGECDSGPSLIFTDGFESGDFSAWSSSSP